MPPEMNKREARAFVRSINADKHTVDAYVSTAALAIDGMIILPRAWTKGMAQFMTNPVVHSYHRYDLGPAGQMTVWSVDTVGLNATTEFAMGRPLGVDMAYCYENRFMRAFSVGVEIKDTTKALSAEDVLEQFGAELPEFVQEQVKAFGEKRKPRKMCGGKGECTVEKGGETGGFFARHGEHNHSCDICRWGYFDFDHEGIPVVTEAQLLEYSCVTVPADMYALVKSRDSRAWETLTRFAIPSECRNDRPGWEDTSPDDPKAGQIRHRIKEPSLFDADSFKTLALDVKGEGDVQLIRGKLKESGEWDTQAVHFNKKDGWTMDAAKDWWKEHEGDKHGAVVEVHLTLDDAMRQFVEGETKEGIEALHEAIHARIQSDADRQVDDELRARIKRIITRA